MRTIILFLGLILFSLSSFSQGVKPVVLISGKGVNERNMKPVAAKIIYEILPFGTEAGIARTNPGNGEYKIILPYGKKYGYYAIAEGFYSVTKHLDVTELTEYKEIDEQNLYLAPVELDQVVELNNIFFEQGKATIKHESLPELNRFIEFLKINKKIEIEIKAHTYTMDSEDGNQALSEKRAQAIADYLIENKIKEQRLTVKGYGDKYPLGFVKTEQEKQKNNRIEFQVTSLTKTKK